MWLLKMLAVVDYDEVWLVGWLGWGVWGRRRRIEVVEEEI